MTLDGIDKPTNQRPNYFAGQYLLEDDFQAEQQYHIDRQRRHNRLLHVSGIAEGLIVSQASGLTVKVTNGTAIDKQGRQIVQLEDINALNLLEKADADIKQGEQLKNGNYILSVGYSCKLSDKQGEDEITSTRLVESPEFKLSSSEPTENIKLVKLTIKTNAVTNIDDSIREYSGLRLPGSSDKPLTLRSGGDRASNLAILSGSLSVADRVGIGTATPTEKLEISDGNLKVSGNISATNVGIGTTSPEVTLHINSPSATTDVSNPSKPWPIETRELVRLTRPPSSVVISGHSKIANAVGLFVGTFEEKSQGGTRFDIALSDYTSVGYGRTPNVKVMTLQSDGNVGIGTTSPKEKLEVSGGNFKVGGDIYATNARLTGNVGIGTEAAKAKLEINSGNTNNLALLLNSSGGGWGSGIQFKNTATNAKTYGIYSGSDSKWLFVDIDGSAVRLVVDKDGNVGIGATSPASKLSVSGGAAIGSTHASTNAAPSNGLLVEGNVYIGLNTTTRLTYYSDRVKTKLLVQSQNNNGGSTPSDSESVLALIRDGVDNQSWGNMADFRLKRYENVGIDARTQLDIQLTDGNFQSKQVMSLRSNGNVGIGTTNPLQTLDVNGRIHLNNGVIQRGGQTAINSTSDLGLYSQVEENYIRFVTQNAPLRFYTDGGIGTNTRMSIEANGKVGIGSTNPRDPLAIRAQGTQEGLISFEDPQGKTKWHLEQNLGGNRPGLNFVETGVADARLFIAAGGNVGIGTFTPTTRFDVNGTITHSGISGRSDIRWKKNIETIASALDKVLQLRGVTFEWRKEEYQEMNFNPGKHLGLIAQEVEQIIPEVVHQNDEGYKSLAYSNLIALSIEALKELQAKHENLLPTIQAQQAEIDALKAELNRQKALLITQPV